MNKFRGKELGLDRGRLKAMTVPWDLNRKLNMSVGKNYDATKLTEKYQDWKFAKKLQTGIS